MSLSKYAERYHQATDRCAAIASSCHTATDGFLSGVVYAALIYYVSRHALIFDMQLHLDAMELPIRHDHAQVGCGTRGRMYSSH